MTSSLPPAGAFYSTKRERESRENESRGLARGLGDSGTRGLGDSGTRGVGKREGEDNREIVLIDPF